MAEPRRHAARYPVAWLRLCQKHPNAESLLVHGLPDVLDELIAEQTAEPDWKKNKRGSWNCRKSDGRRPGRPRCWV